MGTAEEQWATIRSVMPGDNQANALRGLLDPAGRLLEHCRLLTGMASVVEREFALGCAGVTGAAPMTVPAGALQRLCAATRELRPLWEAALLGLARHAAADAPVDDGACRVLIVEDSTDIRDLLAVLVNGAGMKAIVAGDGLEAVLAAHLARPAVILMDVSMPLLDGVEAARLLKLSDVTRNTPILAHTARPQACQEVAAERLFAEVLRKPMPAGAMLTTLRRYTGN